MNPLDFFTNLTPDALVAFIVFLLAVIFGGVIA